ncbi:MAG: hypothetical protein NVS3B14_15280 [Ktedonobacteraceae bacterium]
MSRFVVPIWTSIVVTLAGIWTAIVPFVGPFILGSSMNMGHSMSMAQPSPAMFLGIALSTYVYHIVPGGIVALVGLYQLALGLVRQKQSAPSPAVEKRVQEA